jgi:hypothetical protein
MPTLWEFSQDEWRDGISLAEAENQDRKARRSRFASVIALVKQASLDGELITALRPVAGGLVGDPLPVHVWNTENYQPRFHLCQMKPSDPFSNGLAGVGFQYILVSRESLDKFLAKLVAPPPPSKTDKLVRAAPQTKKYETWLRGEIDKSPHLRSLTHNDIEPVRERYKVSRDEAARIRRDILADKPDDVRKVWSIGGRTPGRKNHTAE